MKEPDQRRRRGLGRRPGCRKIDMRDTEFEEFYLGFSNATLWSLYHDAVRTPTFHREWWYAYVSVNDRYARAVAEAAAPGAMVWVLKSCFSSCRGGDRYSRGFWAPIWSGSRCRGRHRTSRASRVARRSTGSRGVGHRHSVGLRRAPGPGRSAPYIGRPPRLHQGHRPAVHRHRRVVR